MSEKIGQLKMRSPDGKSYTTDVADTEQLFRLIQSIPSPKAEPFKLWVVRGTAYLSLISPFGWMLPKFALFKTGAAVLSHGKRCEKNVQRDEELCKLLDCLLLLPLEVVQQHEPKAEK